jgi:hypothetical protein
VELELKVAKLTEYLSDLETHLGDAEDKGIAFARREMLSLVMMRITWRTWTWRIRRIVGTPDYPSRIPDMHTIHDPMISML